MTSKALNDLVKKLGKRKKPRGPFVVRPSYCPTGDFLTVYLRDVASYGLWLNNDVSVLRDMETDEVIGFELRGVSDFKRWSWRKGRKKK